MGIRLLLGENYLEGLCNEKDLLLRTPECTTSIPLCSRRSGQVWQSPARWSCFSTCVPAKSATIGRQDDHHLGD